MMMMMINHARHKFILLFLKLFLSPHESFPSLMQVISLEKNQNRDQSLVFGKLEFVLISCMFSCNSETRLITSSSSGIVSLLICTCDRHRVTSVQVLLSPLKGD